MPPNARSRGYATLSVVSILTLIFSALALSSTRHVITDSHAMRNQLLAKRALAQACTVDAARLADESVPLKDLLQTASAVPAI
mgnify:CR=1 FL=1